VPADQVHNTLTNIGTLDLDEGRTIGFFLQQFWDFELNPQS
jgi:hypothetical protein